MRHYCSPAPRKPMLAKKMVDLAVIKATSAVTLLMHVCTGAVEQLSPQDACHPLHVLLLQQLL